jgi:hypothetical protein
MSLRSCVSLVKRGSASVPLAPRNEATRTHEKQVDRAAVGKLGQPNRILCRSPSSFISLEQLPLLFRLDVVRFRQVDSVDAIDPAFGETGRGSRTPAAGAYQDGPARCGYELQCVRDGDSEWSSLDANELRETNVDDDLVVSVLRVDTTASPDSARLSASFESLHFLVGENDVLCIQRAEDARERVNAVDIGGVAARLEDERVQGNGGRGRDGGEGFGGAGEG